MAGDARMVAIEACDGALSDSVNKISLVLMNAFTSATTEKGRNTAVERARKGLELSKEVHTAMRGLVEDTFR